MRQLKLVLLGTLLLLAGSSLCGTLSGCGGGPDVSDVTTSPEAKKADEGLQGGMKDFMQSKNKTKTPKR